MRGNNVLSFLLFDTRMYVVSKQSIFQLRYFPRFYVNIICMSTILDFVFTTVVHPFQPNDKFVSASYK